ncbi:hypothetical protein L0337_00035 [candidate division KSB1 bacterium]|nr:hypothetical protein [candidate division KSB1 bacterium]
MNLKKSLLPFFLFIFVFFLSGCFEYEETITIRKDGSGEMAVHFFGPEDSDMEVDGFKLGKKEREMREQIERKFSAPGVRVKSYESKIKGDAQHVYFTVAFDQFASLARVRWFDDQKIDAGRWDGRNSWRRTLSSGDHHSDEESRFGEWLKEKIADELADHIKLRFAIETDGEITDTNARDRMPHRAVWRFDGADFLKPEGLEMKVSWK